MPKSSIILLIIYIACVLCSCSSPKWGQDTQINVQANHDANDSMATSLDIVFIYDENLAVLLPKTSDEWFTKSDAVLKGHSSALDVIHIQVPAGMPLQKIDLPARHRKAKEIIAYANYHSVKEQYPARLMPFKCVDITLKHDELVHHACR